MRQHAVARCTRRPETFRLAIVAAALALTASATSAQYPSFTTTPTLQPNANPAAPLVATVHAETDVPTRVWLSLDHGGRTTTVSGGTAYATSHDVRVLGVEAGTTVGVSVVAVDANGYQTVAPVVLDFVTPALPPEFPPIDVQVVDEERREPGYVLFGPRGTSGPTSQFLVMLDGAGRVVWFLQGYNGGERMRNGNFLVTRERDLTSIEIDVEGNVVREWYAAALNGGVGASPGAILVGLDSMHHEFTQMPEEEEADFLLLGSEGRAYMNYPLSESDPDETDLIGYVIGDTIVEMKANGTVVRQKSLLAVLDPYRIGYDSIYGPYWTTLYGAGARDWSHANSVLFDPSDDTYIVSLRHQECIVKIRRGVDGVDSPDDIVWILGTPEGWREPWSSKLLSLEGTLIDPDLPADLELEWPFHTHHARLNAAGNLTLFDNGNYRVMPPTPKPDPALSYSRAVEYSIDEDNLSLRQVWAAGGIYDADPNRIGYSWFVSGTEHQERTGNVLVCAGGLREPLSGTSYTRILELERETKDAVLDVVVRDPADAMTWATYRALRYDDLQPQPEPDGVELRISPIRRGEMASATVRGVEPGRMVLFVYSRDGRGNGPCWRGTICSGLIGTHVLFASVPAGIDGTATFRGTVPADAIPGREFHFQAFAMGGTSPVVSARME